MNKCLAGTINFIGLDISRRLLQLCKGWSLLKTWITFMDIVPIIEHKSGMGGFLYSNRESSKKTCVSFGVLNYPEGCHSAAKCLFLGLYSTLRTNMVNSNFQRASRISFLQLSIPTKCIVGKYSSTKLQAFLLLLCCCCFLNQLKPFPRQHKAWRDHQSSHQKCIWRVPTNMATKCRESWQNTESSFRGEQFFLTPCSYCTRTEHVCTTEITEQSSTTGPQSWRRTVFCGERFDTFVAKRPLQITTSVRFYRLGKSIHSRVTFK